MARAGADGHEGFGWGQRVLTEKRPNIVGNLFFDGFLIFGENVVSFWRRAWGVLEAFGSSFFWAG